MLLELASVYIHNRYTLSIFFTIFEPLNSYSLRTINYMYKFCCDQTLPSGCFRR